MVYEHPQLCNVLGGINICIRDIATVWTTEVLAFSITNTLAHIADLACIAGVDRKKKNTIKPGFVFKKGAKLRKCPRVMFSPLTLPDSGSFSDVGQVLNGNPHSKVSGLFYNALTDRVVGNSGESTFSALKPFQKFSASLRAFALNGATHFEKLVSGCIQLIGTKRRSIGKHSNVGHAKVHTDKGFNVLNILFGDFNCLEKIELTFLCHKVCFPFDIWKKLFIMADKGNLQPAVNRPDRGGLSFIRENAGIVGDSSKRLKRTLLSPVKFVGINHLTDAAYEHLSRKTGSFLKIMINKVVSLELIENFLIPDNLRNVIANCIARFHGSQKRFSLFLCWYKFNLESEFHKFMITQTLEKVKKGGRAFLPAASGRGILPG